MLWAGKGCWDGERNSLASSGVLTTCSGTWRQGEALSDLQLMPVLSEVFGFFSGGQRTVIPLHSKEQAWGSWEQHQWTHQLASPCTKPLQIFCLSGLTDFVPECPTDAQELCLQRKLPRGGDGGGTRWGSKGCPKYKQTKV